MKYEILSARTDLESQNKAGRLLGHCFPDYWEQIAAKGEGFPFTELSFLAVTADGTLCGHAGILPFSVCDGNGGILRLAGLASVAVLPEYRGQGIAARLCNAAAEWAEQNHFDAVPLFTGKCGVYAGHGWCLEPSAPAKQVAPPSSNRKPMKFLPSSALTEHQKSEIIRFYENSPSFRGKVLRTTDRAFHGWPRIFGEPDFEFLVRKNGYLIRWGGAVIELCAEDHSEFDLLSAAENLPFTLALPPEHPVWSAMTSVGWNIAGEPDDVYHGESVMIRPIRKDGLSGIYFPCADKF